MRSPKLPPPRPMLAATARIADIALPCFSSFKLDGIRAVSHNKVLYSRSGKLIPNRYIQRICRTLPSGWDGELTLPQGQFYNVASAIMAQEGEPDFIFTVFDRISSTTFPLRLQQLQDEFLGLRLLVPPNLQRHFQLHQHTLITSRAQLSSALQIAIDAGAEGLCTRGQASGYKHGRGTLRDQALCKLKPFLDAEAEIISVLPATINTAPRIISPLGFSERTHRQGDKVEIPMLGKMLVRDLKSRKEFEIGSFRLTEDEKTHLWTTRRTLPGRVITYRYLPHGEKDLPRNTSFLRFRHKDDIS